MKTLAEIKLPYPVKGRFWTTNGLEVNYVEGEGVIINTESQYNYGDPLTGYESVGPVRAAVLFVKGHIPPKTPRR